MRPALPLALHAVGKASSSKKVQRAAKAAASSRGASEKRELGFPLTIAVVVILGIALVVIAREGREVVAPTTADHWHSAYTVYDCGTPVAEFQSVADPDGIHSHQDGLIHIHPFNSSATGTDAQLSVFFEAMEATVSSDEIIAREFQDIVADDGCGDEAAVIKIGRFEVDPEIRLVAVYDRDFGEVQFLSDREAFTIAKVPVGEDPPAPSAAALAQLEASTGSDRISQDPVPLETVTTDGESDAPDSDG
jgi:hypothetical protein